MLWKTISLVIFLFLWFLFFSKNPNIENVKNFEAKKILTSTWNKNIENIKTNIWKLKNNFETKIFEIKNPKNVRFSSWFLASWEDFLINWPLFWEDFLPLWGYVSGWKQIKNFWKIKNPAPNFWLDNWIFWLWIDWKFYLDFSKNYKNKKFLRAFQNWPILVLDWKNIRKEDKLKYNRSWIGFTENWKAIVIYSPLPITLQDFGNIFLQAWATNAIYLDWAWPAWYQTSEWKVGNLSTEAIKLHFF